MFGASSRMSCRQLFKELNILTLSSLYMYILEVTSFIRKYCQSLEQNSKFHKYNTRSKMDIHVKLHKTEIYKKSVINMGTKLYNNLPGYIKEIDDYEAFKRVKIISSSQFYSVEESVTSWQFTYDIYLTFNYTKYS
jgi:hypothetical protein